MKYAIVTVEWCSGKGIAVPAHARRSVDGGKVVIHYEFIAPVLAEGEEVEVYDWNSAELGRLLSGGEWTKDKEDDV